jgi:hypothetical protein
MLRDQKGSCFTKINPKLPSRGGCEGTGITKQSKESVRYGVAYKTDLSIIIDHKISIHFCLCWQKQRLIKKKQADFL